MYTTKIYGAGSIGNHLAHAFRDLGWHVAICDTDPEALSRTQNDIYPSRYGAWDDAIELASVEELSNGKFDVVAIGTPPESHVDILRSELEGGNARLILVEKPLCGPGLEGCNGLLELARDAGVTVCVGYNHVLTANTRMAEEAIAGGKIGVPRTITVNWVEHWGGIFAAHPWLSGPGDSYLGFSAKGGGACGEHSHGVNIWQHFAHALGVGRIVRVSAVMDRVHNSDVDYDRITQLSVVSESGLTGYVVQDVVTIPPRKQLTVQGEAGALEWRVNLDGNHDAVRLWLHDSWHEELIPRKRTDDFAAEARHIKEILDGKVEDSPISLERGLDTMMVIAAANLSAREGRVVSIDYSAGFTAAALNPGFAPYTS